MRLTFCLIVCLVQILSQASAAKGKYTVIAPGTIHSHEKYTVAVAVHQTNEPCVIKVGITGPSYNEIKEVEMSQDEVKNVEFDLPHLERGDYNLTAEGINCVDNFKNTTRLIYNKFDNIVSIQTDMATYKPGEDIHFRVIFMDKNLKPAEPEKSAVIWFEDNKHNRIKEIKDFKVVKGVYTGKFSISKYPPTGVWTLGVSNGALHDENVHFLVEEYGLPQYVVNVEATKAVSVKDGDMQVIVRANRTNGQPLKGKATVYVTLNSKEQPPALIKSADMVEGKAKIDFNVREFDIYLNDNLISMDLLIDAIVKEQSTGVKINGTASSIIYPFRYAIDCVDYHKCSTFEAGKERDVLLQITYIDGSPLEDTISTVELVYKEAVSKTSWWPSAASAEDNNDDDSEIVATVAPPVSENRAITFKGHMNETGFVNFKVSLPDLPEYDGYLHFYSMEIKYLDEKRQICDVSQVRKPKQIDPPPQEDNKSKEYFILNDMYSTEEISFVNKPNRFTVHSSEPLSYFVYNVIGRGNILQSGRFDLPDKPKIYNFTLTPDILWAPQFAVYVYTIDENGKFRSAEQHFDTEFELENQITVTAPKQVKPGEEVTLKIQTTPNSFVGLMAVDQNSLLWSRSNDFIPNVVKGKLDSYSTATPLQGGSSEYPGTVSGCVTLTNGNYFYNWTKPYLESYGVGGPDVRWGRYERVPNDYSATWLFTDIENTETAEFTWTEKIPKTLTSWVLTAFSMNPTKGLGVTRDKTKITTFQPFFISVRLPYSVKRGEVVNVPALVFNYFTEDLDVEVTLDNSDNEYEFIKFDNATVQETKLSKSIRVPAKGSARVSFLLKPNTIGNVMLKFTAVSAVAGDALHKFMKVVPEGITKYASRAYFVNLEQESEFKSTFALELPEDLVPDSDLVEVEAIGDILGRVLYNLDNLVRLPSGCGEHTISVLLSNSLILKYLTNSKRLTSTLDRKLRDNLEIAYQNILKNRHEDGSFSSFGPSTEDQKPRNGSTWLTAYAVHSLQQIREFVSVKDHMIEESLDYLSKQQAENGTFTEKGDYLYVSQRNHIALTGTAISAILENATYAEKYAQELNKGLDFIAENIDKSDSLYAKALGTYTLNKAKRSEAKEKLSKLKTLAKTESDRMWWSEEKEQDAAGGNRRGYTVFSKDVETTSYALLTLLDQDSTKVDDVVPIIKWLIAQRNRYGGFASTQDTVVGLTALINFAKFADYEPAKVTIDIEPKLIMGSIISAYDNSILYYSVGMSQIIKSIDFTAKGNGLVQIAYQYNSFEKDPNPSFTIKTTKTENTGRFTHLELIVCVSYVGDGDASNMAVLEFTTPSGYVIYRESLKKIQDLERVSNIELKNSDSLLVVYFDHLHKTDETCLTIRALMSHDVAMQKPSSIVLYDYYDTHKKATAFYEVESNLCDICGGLDYIKCQALFYKDLFSLL